MTMKRYLLHIILLAAVLSLTVGCSSVLDDSPTDADGKDNVWVNLSVSTRGIYPDENGNMYEPGSGSPASMHLWIYGSKGNPTESNYTLLTYKNITTNLFVESDPFGNPLHAIEEIIEEGKRYDKLHFYILLNEGSVTEMSGVNEKTTIEQLKALTFTGIESGKEDNALLMYGEKEITISSKTNYEVEIPVERSVAKLELYFTKNNTKSNLTINSIQLSSPIAKGYLVKKDLTNDNSIYTTTAVNPVKTTVSDGEIKEVSVVDYGHFSSDEKNFKQIELTNPYLMENPNGVDWKVENGTYPEETSTNGYSIKVNYTLDNVGKEKTFYLPAIERNTLYKIYVRIREMYWEASVVPYGSYDLKPGFGL